MIRDIFDVLIVAWVLYRVFMVVWGTRALQIVVGVVVIALVYGLAKVGGFVALVNLIDFAASGTFFLLIVVFQNDIRRALMRVGDKALVPIFARTRETAALDEVVAAVTDLARHRTGALIAFERNANLDEFVTNRGIDLDASISQELLVTIFQPESANKLHDGAVLVRSLRIARAGVFFPMPEARNLDASLGSRHRAALGVTEETDALVVVVSEERGTITVCYRGNMIPNLDGQRLKTVLFDLMGYWPQGKGKKDAKKEEKSGDPRKSVPSPSPLPLVVSGAATSTPRSMPRPAGGAQPSGLGTSSDEKRG